MEFLKSNGIDVSKSKEDQDEEKEKRDAGDKPKSLTQKQVEKPVVLTDSQKELVNAVDTVSKKSAITDLDDD